MKLVLTRPFNDSLEFQKLLESNNFNINFVIEPLLEIEYLYKIINVSEEKYYILSSINSARSLAKNTKNRNLKLIAIGYTTAQCATLLGFKNVTCVTYLESELFGEEALLYYIKNNNKADDKFVHISANVTKGGIKRGLKQMGFDLETIILYNSKSRDLSDETIHWLSNGQKLGFVFFSPRTAAIFAKQIIDKKLQENLINCFAFCFSQNVLNIVEGLGFGKKYIPEKVTSNDFVNLIKSKIYV